MSTLSETLASPISSNAWHEMLSHPEGRERIFRLLQYSLRLARGLSSGRSTPKDPNIQRLAALEVTVASARQLWRMFKWSGVYTKAVNSLGSSSNSRRVSYSVPSQALGLLQDGFLASYFILDNIAFLTKTSMISGNPKLATQRASKAWFVASVIGFLRCLRKLSHWKTELTKQKRAGTQISNQRSSTSSLQADIRMQTVMAAKYAGDAVVALSLFQAQPAHPTIVGSCGVISSMVGIWQIWPRNAGRENA